MQSSEHYSFAMTLHENHVYISNCWLICPFPQLKHSFWISKFSLIKSCSLKKSALYFKPTSLGQIANVDKWLLVSSLSIFTLNELAQQNWHIQCKPFQIICICMHSLNWGHSNPGARSVITEKFFKFSEYACLQNKDLIRQVLLVPNYYRKLCIEPCSITVS